MTASTEGIGLGIAESLAKHGASVMISSRKEANVEAAVAKLRADGHEVAGAVCHVGKPEDRNKLLKVKYNSGLSQLHIFPFLSRKQSTGSEASIFWSPTLPSTLTLVSCHSQALRLKMSCVYFSGSIIDCPEDVWDKVREHQILRIIFYLIYIF